MGKSHVIVPRGWVKVSEFEALTGLNNRTVTLAIKRGGIPSECWRRVGEGKTSPICINPQSAAVHWYRHLNGTHHLTQPLRDKLAAYIRTFDPAGVEDQEGDTMTDERGGDQEGNTNIKDEEAEGDSVRKGGGDKMTFAEAQRRKEVAKAKTAELEFLEKEGSLISKAAVQDQLFNVGKELRDALLAVPDRVTDEILAAGDNRTKVNNIIYDAIAGELERLADLYIK